MKITRKIFWPHNVYAIMSMVSFLGWLAPDLGILRKGFDKPQDLASAAGCWVIASIFICYMALKVGFILGGGQEKSETGRAHIYSNDSIYLIVIFIAIVGDTYSMFSIYRSGGIGVIFSSLTDGSANYLKKALYEDYSVGFATLRYTSILAGALLFARRLAGVKSILSDLMAFLSLSICAVISSRLSLVAACFGGGYIYMQAMGKVKIKIWKIVLFGIVIFLTLSLLSWTRNKNFYSSQGMGFLSSGVSEIITYLGAPFQGAIFSFVDPEQSVGNDLYFKAGIESSLTTNSAFVDLFSSYGSLGFVLGVVVLFLSGAALGLFGKFKDGRYALVCFPITYGVAEFWRVFLFDKGILMYLISITLLVSFFNSKNEPSVKRGS